ncbi:MAG: hypothetical protein K6F08_03035, partial [bacterium]|nr:hypothetical protein [bacterium]
INLPESFKANMKALLKDDYIKFEESFKEPAKRGLVFNNNSKFKIEDLNLSVRPLPDGMPKFCYFLDSDAKLGNAWFHHAGLIYLQEPSSMVAGAVLVNALKDCENPCVLDLCASPGGKSIDVKLGLKNVRLVSNEIVTNRAKVLYSNLERLGLDNFIVLNNSPKEIAREVEEVFDGCLVDAPCSGEGMFRKNPETILEWNNELPAKNAQRQFDILSEAVKCVKPNGYIVYSTCTYNTLENEGVVLRAIKELGLKIVKVSNEIEKITDDGIEIESGFDLKLARRCYPFGTLGEGQFICLLQKVQKNEQKEEKVIKNLQKTAKVGQNEQKVLKIAKEFIAKTLDNFNFELKVCGESVYVRNEFDGLKLNYVSRGIKVGDVTSDRMIPHHQFFRVYGNLFKNKIKLTFEQMKDYLRGLEVKLDNDLNGFVSVFYSGVCLGGAKAVSGTLKNYYPKGLRAVI